MEGMCFQQRAISQLEVDNWHSTEVAAMSHEEGIDSDRRVTEDALAARSEPLP